MRLWTNGSRVAGLAIAMLCIVYNPAKCISCDDYSAYIRWRSTSYDSRPPIYDVNGYIATGWCGSILCLLDYTRYSLQTAQCIDYKIEFLGRVSMPDYDVFDMITREDTCFIANGYSGLVMACSGAGEPYIIESIPVGFNAKSVYACSNIAIVGGDSVGCGKLAIVSGLTDIKHSVAKRDVGGIPLDIYVHDNIIYIACGAPNMGVRAFIITADQRLKEVDYVPTEGEAHCITQANNVLYIGYQGISNASGIAMFIIEGSSLKHIGDVNVPASPLNLSVIQNVLYACCGPYGIYIWDMQDATTPIYVGRISTTAWASSIAAQNSKMIVAEMGDWYTWAGIQTFDFGNMHAPLPRGMFDLGGFGYQTMAVENDLAILAGYNYLQSVDVSNADCPQVLSTYNLTGAHKIRLIGRHVFLLGAGPNQDELHILYINLHGSFEPLGNITLPGNGMGLWLEENTAYIANGSYGLTAVDVECPEAPSILWTLPVIGRNIDVVVHNQRIYLSDTAGYMHIYDISNPMDPLYISSAEGIINPYAIAYKDGYVLIGTSGRQPYGDNVGSLLAYDVSNTSVPMLVKECELPGSALALEIEGSWLYALSGSGILVCDIRQPADVKYLGQMQAKRNIIGYGIEGNDLFEVSLDDKLYVYHAQCGDLTAVADTKFEALCNDGCVLLNWNAPDNSGIEEFIIIGQAKENQWQLKTDNEGSGHFSIRDNRPFIHKYKEVNYTLYASTGSRDVLYLSNIEHVACANIYEDGYIEARPIPSRGGIEIRYRVEEDEKVGIKIFNLKGECIANLGDRYCQRGKHEFFWDGCAQSGNRVASGVYLVTLQGSNWRRSCKILLSH